MLDTTTTVANVLRALKESGVPLQKIILHKFIYFLNTQGLCTGLDFEPYTYGPFSFDLARTLSKMSFWDEIKEEKSYYDIVDLSAYPMPDNEFEQKVNKHLDDFKNMVGDLSFDNIEGIGTALYCAESLKILGESISKQKIIKEFKKWKGDRYPDSKIESYYIKIKPFIGN